MHDTTVHLAIASCTMIGICVNYLIGTQLSTSEGLVAAAVAIAGLWCVYAVPAYLDLNPNS